MKKTMVTFVIAALILLAITGTAGAAGQMPEKSGVITNVWFSRMIENGDTYDFEYLPTLYTGVNEYGRFTFITGTTNLTPGNYAVVQISGNGTKLVQSLTLTQYGSAIPEYALLVLELRKEELPLPLEIIGDTGIAVTITPTLSATKVPQLSDQVPDPDVPGSVPATTKSPAGLQTLIVSLVIGMFIGAVRARR